MQHPPRGASAAATPAKFGGTAKTHGPTERLTTVTLPRATHSCLVRNQHASHGLPNSVELEQLRDLTRKDAPAPCRWSLKFGSLRQLFLLISDPRPIEISELHGFFC
jgi:hypothetical protein